MVNGRFGPTHSPLESRIIQSNSNPTMTYQHSQKSQPALSLVQTFPVLCTRWASTCLLHDQLSILLFCAFFDTWRTLSFMASSTLLNLLLFSTHSLMLIRQEIPLIADPPLVITFFLVFLWFLGRTRNKPLWPAPVLKQNIVPLLIPHLSSFSYDGFLRT